ncbi:hypothetical protein Tco_0258424, partial [Tanacetum coccineum]
RASSLANSSSKRSTGSSFPGGNESLARYASNSSQINSLSSKEVIVGEEEDLVMGSKIGVGLPLNGLITSG